MCATRVPELLVFLASGKGPKRSAIVREINRDAQRLVTLSWLVGHRSTMYPLFRTSVSTVFEPPLLRTCVREIIGLGC